MTGRRVKPWVNSYERFAKAIANQFWPSREILWLDPASFTVSDNEDANRTEVRAFVPDTAPGIEPIAQLPFLAASGGMTVLMFADTEKPSHFTGASFFAGDSLTAHDSNYVDVTLYTATEAAVQTAIPGATANTKTTGSGGSGDWVGGHLVIDIGAGVDVPAGQYVVAVWTQHGAGVDVGGGWWRRT